MAYKDNNPITGHQHSHIHIHMHVYTEATCMVSCPGLSIRASSVPENEGSYSWYTGCAWRGGREFSYCLGNPHIDGSSCAVSRALS